MPPTCRAYNMQSKSRGLRWKNAQVRAQQAKITNYIFLMRQHYRCRSFLRKLSSLSHHAGAQFQQRDLPLTMILCLRRCRKLHNNFTRMLQEARGQVLGARLRRLNAAKQKEALPRSKPFFFVGDGVGMLFFIPRCGFQASYPDT